MASQASSLDGLRRFMNKYQALSAGLRADRDDFLVEFLLVKQEAAEWCEQGKCNSFEGAREVNRKKNRYKDILPFDASRVLLPKIGGDGSDYINANYIKVPSGDVEYIASQGPMPSTVDDFWRMIWKHKPKVIAMLCKEIELGKHRCQRYWPEEKEDLKFGDIRVTLIFDNNIGDNLHLRHIKYSKGKEEHKVAQIHYTAWPDHGAPDSSSPILHLIEQMREEQGNSTTPLVVHCSAGCGRTGAVIAIDIARKMIERKAPDLSVLEIVRQLRMQRPAMVQSREQYEYVYDVVNELVERELERSSVDAGVGCPTYVNIQQFKTTADSVYAVDNEYQDSDVTEGFKRTFSLKDHSPTAPPKVPVKSSKSERSASSSAILVPDTPKGTTLPQPARRNYANQPQAPERSNHEMDRAEVDWAVSLVRPRPEKDSSLTPAGKSSDYELIPRSRSAVISSGDGSKGTVDGQQGRPQLAAKPVLADKVSPTKLHAGLDSGRRDAIPAKGPLYSPLLKTSRPNHVDSNYEQIWPEPGQPQSHQPQSPPQNQPLIQFDTEELPPPLPERTPESFRSLSESDTDYGSIDDGDVREEHQGWLSGRLKKIGNIMSPITHMPSPPTRGKSSTSSDSVFYTFDEVNTGDGKRRSFERIPEKSSVMSSYPTVELGFGKRVPTRPRGPRQQPSDWPNYVRQHPLGSL